MTKANTIPCDFNLAFYTVMGNVKYDDYENSSNACIFYKKDDSTTGRKTVAHYDKKQEILRIYD